MGNSCRKSEDENSRKKQQGSRGKFTDLGGLPNAASDGRAASTDLGQKREKYKNKGNGHVAVDQSQDKHDQRSLQASKHKSPHKDKTTKKKQKSQNIQSTSERETPIVDRPRCVTKDKVPLVANVKGQSRNVSNTGMKDKSHNTACESTSGGNSNSGHRDESDALQRAGPSTSLPDKGMETSGAEAKKLKEKLTRTNEELYGVRQELDIAKREFNEERRKLQKELHRSKEQIKQVEEEKNELLNRLSSIAAARMTRNNPNITDLSDQNRPTKIAERFSELYDNQWTDAFDNLQNKHGLPETDAIEFLLDVLYISFNVCKEVRKQRERLLEALKGYIGEDEDNEDVTILEVLRTLKGTKRNIKKMQEQFKQNVEETLAKNTNYKGKIQDIKSYINECVEVCLLMNIQEPPVELKGLVLSSGDPFDLSFLRAYTESGNLIKYMVWPAIYLYKNGPLLCKGVAQGMSYSSGVNKPMSAKLDTTSETIATEVSEQQAAPKVESINDQVSNVETVNIERENHKKKLKASPTLTGSHNESSPHESQRKTEKSRGQDDKPGSSQLTHNARMDAISQSTETIPNHSTTTWQQQRVDKPVKKMSITVIDVKSPTKRL